MFDDILVTRWLYTAYISIGGPAQAELKDILGKCEGYYTNYIL